MPKWAKGESGNPGGRPSGLGEIREIARKHTDAAIETLVKVMENKEASPSAQVAAATALLDRGWGRPAQTINATIDADHRNQQLEAALEERASKLMKQIREITPENTREAEPQPSPLRSQ